MFSEPFDSKECKYYVLDSAGSGASGRIFRAMVKTSGKIVVLKMVEKKEFASDEVNICKEIKKKKSEFFSEMIDYFQFHEKYFIVLECYNFGDVNNFVVNNRYYLMKNSYSPDFVIPIVCQMILCVYVLHFYDIIHGDIKPHNFFVNNHCNLVLGDFGNSYPLRGKKYVVDKISGTPYYMAPELMMSYDFVKAKNHGHTAFGKWCDIYSLGSSIYALFTGHPPFFQWEYENIKQYFIEFRPSPKNLKKYTSEKLANIVEKMMSFDFKSRPTIDEIVNDSYIRQLISKYVKKRIPEMLVKKYLSSPDSSSLSSSPVVASHQSQAQILRRKSYEAAARKRSDYTEMNSKSIFDGKSVSLYKSLSGEPPFASRRRPGESSSSPSSSITSSSNPTNLPATPSSSTSFIPTGLPVAAPSPLPFSASFPKCCCCGEEIKDGFDCTCSLSHPVCHRCFRSAVRSACRNDRSVVYCLVDLGDGDGGNGGSSIDSGGGDAVDGDSSDSSSTGNEDSDDDDYHYNGDEDEGNAGVIHNECCSYTREMLLKHMRAGVIKQSEFEKVYGKDSAADCGEQNDTATSPLFPPSPPSSSSPSSSSLFTSSSLSASPSDVLGLTSSAVSVVPVGPASSAASVTATGPSFSGAAAFPTPVHFPRRDKYICPILLTPYASMFLHCYGPYYPGFYPYGRVVNPFSYSLLSPLPSSFPSQSPPLPPLSSPPILPLPSPPMPSSSSSSSSSPSSLSLPFSPFSSSFSFSTSSSLLPSITKSSSTSFSYPYHHRSSLSPRPAKTTRLVSPGGAVEEDEEEEEEGREGDGEREGSRGERELKEEGNARTSSSSGGGGREEKTGDLSFLEHRQKSRVRAYEEGIGEGESLRSVSNFTLNEDLGKTPTLPPFSSVSAARVSPKNRVYADSLPPIVKQSREEEEEEGGGGGGVSGGSGRGNKWQPQQLPTTPP